MLQDGKITINFIICHKRSICEGRGISLIKLNALPLTNLSFFLGGSLVPKLEIVLSPGVYVFDFSAYISTVDITPPERSYFCMYITNSGGTILQDLQECCYRQQTIGGCCKREQEPYYTEHIIAITSGIVTVPVTSNLRIHGAREFDTQGTTALVYSASLRAIKMS